MEPFPISHERIAAVLKAPMDSVRSNWPLVMAALEEQGILSRRVGIAALATIGTEVPRFEPIREFGGPRYLNAHYDTRTDLGNTPELDGDGALYCGRGFIQLTGRNNYKRFGQALGIDLVGNPDMALNPVHASRIFALYFRTRRVAGAAEAQDWMLVRRRVNGGLNGWDRFIGLVGALTGEIQDTQARAVGRA